MPFTGRTPVCVQEVPTWQMVKQQLLQHVVNASAHFASVQMAFLDKVDNIIMAMQSAAQQGKASTAQRLSSKVADIMNSTALLSPRVIFPGIIRCALPPHRLACCDVCTLLPGSLR